MVTLTWTLIRTSIAVVAVPHGSGDRAATPTVLRMCIIFPVKNCSPGSAVTSSTPIVNIPCSGEAEAGTGAQRPSNARAARAKANTTVRFMWFTLRLCRLRGGFKHRKGGSGRPEGWPWLRLPLERRQHRWRRKSMRQVSYLRGSISPASCIHDSRIQVGGAN